MSDTWLDGKEARKVLARMIRDARPSYEDIDFDDMADALLAAGIRVPDPGNLVIEQAARVLADTPGHWGDRARALDAAGLLVKEVP